MPRFTLLSAPSRLGLREAGVEQLPTALQAAGLHEKVAATGAGRVEPLPYSDTLDPDTHLLNGAAIRAYAFQLADALAPLLDRGDFPIVLGGDCSILLGPMLALRRRGRFGLFFVDGHTDFYQPEAEPTGEVASMELAFVSGRGPSILAQWDGLEPLARDEDIVAFASRDADEAKEAGSQNIREVSTIQVYDLSEVRALGLPDALERGLAHLTRDDVEGFWIHLDTDVLDSALMPAVDYLLPDGLSFPDLSTVLQTLLASGRAVGMTVTIFNPTLDPDGTIARRFVDALALGLLGT